MTEPVQPKLVEPVFSEEGRAHEEAWQSKAIVACDGDGNGNGVVIYYVGGSLENEIDNCGLKDLGALGFDDAPEGLSVWEGVFVWSPGPYEHPEDGETSPSGAFRDLTEDEWAAVKNKVNPWESSESES